MDYKTTEKNKIRWWDSRSKVEKCCILLLTLSAVTIIYLASNLFMKFPSKDELSTKVCMTDKCIITSSSILQKLDRKVDPCDDFYKFACGNFIKNAEIPDEKVMVTSVTNLGDKVQLQVKQILEAPISASDKKYVKLVKTLYQSCMNVSKIESEGLKYFKRKFDDFGGWPVLMPENSWNERNFDWKKLLYRFRKIGWRQNLFLSLYIDTDHLNSSRRILTISQPCLPYEALKKGFNDSTVRASYNLMVSLATLFGANPAEAAAEMREVIEFTIELAKIITPHDQRKNASLQYNPTTIRQLQKNFTTIPWQQFINVYLSPVDMLASGDMVNVAVPAFLKKLETLLENTRKRTLANYMFVRIVLDSTSHLPEAFRKQQLEFRKVAYGVEEATPRWDECVWSANRLGIAISAIYVKNFFNITVQHKVTDLVLDIKSSFIETLKKTGWMDKKTKKHALLKAEKMKSLIGFPLEILDDDNVDSHYNGLELNLEDYFLEAVYNISLFRHMLTVKKLREPVVKDDWRDFADTLNYVNAFYSGSGNSIELPAAVLQGSFFSSDNPQYMNYGAIGSVIGHEITHGFDDQGRQFDKDGNLIDWWEPETNRTFARKSQCLVEQYGNYTIPEINMSLNGVKTLGENIADNGGIKIAYRGYQKWLERSKEEELKLPGLKYSPKQLFWISAAHIWCTKYKKEFLKKMVTSSVHLPNYFRVVIPFMNSDYFARDFNCPLGSNMNPKYKCRVW